MRSGLPFLLVGALAPMCLACGPSRETALARIAEHDDALRARASFDLHCAKTALTVTPLKEYPVAYHEDVKYVVLAGVTGCERRATYVYDDRRGIWILNMDAVPETVAK